MNYFQNNWYVYNNVSKSLFNAATSHQPRRTFFGGRQGHRVILFG